MNKKTYTDAQKKTSNLTLLGACSWHPSVGKESCPLPQKAFVLLALLHLAFEGCATRNAIAARLFEDADQGTALTNFRQLISRIRKQEQRTGCKLIDCIGNEVRLAVDEKSSPCDLIMFRGIELPDTEPALLELQTLYKGDLLEGSSDYGPTLEAWILLQRNRLRDRYVELTLSGAEAVRGAAGEAALRRLIDIDPYQEEAWRTLIDLRAESRGVDAAKSIYQEMRNVFDRELDVRPDAKTEALLANINLEQAPKAWSELFPTAGGVELLTPSQFHTIKPAVPKLCLLMPISNDKGSSTDPLAQVLIEDVTLGLCRLRSIAMIAPHTAWHLSEGLLPSDRFGIDYLAETTVQAFAGDLRLLVKLVRMADRQILWVEKFDINAGMQPEHFNNLSQSIVLALADGVEKSELERDLRTERPEAYRLYLTGRHHLRTLDLPAIRKARRAFAKAVDLSPDFVPALNGVSRTMTLEWLLLARVEKDLLNQSERIAARAVKIDPLSGEALREEANALLFLGRLDDAVEKLARAERLIPHHADILADYSNALTHASQLHSAMQRIELAFELNPMPPDNYHWKAAGTKFFLEQYDDALFHLEQMAMPAPAFRLKAACLAMLDRREDATRCVRRALEDQPNFNVDEWAASIPLKSRDHMLRYVGALKAAGFD